MTYFVDFDRTLFDTDRFQKDYAEQLSLAEGEPGIIHRTLAKLLAEGNLTFTQGELTPYLYADAAEFLRGLGNEATIITRGDVAFQTAKVKSALVGIPRLSVFYTGENSKAAYLAPRIDAYRDPVLVDDKPLELEILATTCPALRLYEMRRDGEKGDGRWSIVQSLGELPST